MSKRTVQLDLQMMRSDKLGYNAPIIVVDKKYYTYKDPDYSITNIPLTDQDLNKLTETIDFLKQFRGFSHFQELEEMVQKLEDQIYSQKTNRKPVIDFEKNENLKGLEHLDPLYRAIVEKNMINLTYQSFKARSPDRFNFSPFLLKEFKNRWFVIGVRKQREGILNLALDRVQYIEVTENHFQIPSDFDPETYFHNVIGVSVSPNLEPEEIILYVLNKHAPYVLTKPMHHSQEFVERDSYGITIKLRVQHNFELEKEILGFGDGIKVIAPTRLKRNIKDRLKNGLELYNTELTEHGLKAANKMMLHKGSCVLNYIYGQREVRHIRKKMDQLTSDEVYEHDPINLYDFMPKIKQDIINQNLRKIIGSLDPSANLIRATYFNRLDHSKPYVSWGQKFAYDDNKLAKLVLANKEMNIADAVNSLSYTFNTASFIIRIHLEDMLNEHGAMSVIPGSHKKTLDVEQINLITKNSVEYIAEVYSGGIQILSPLLINCNPPSRNQKLRRIIQLEFSSLTLPNPLNWKEELKIS